MRQRSADAGTEAYSETVKLFGKRILSSDGRIDRKALGGIVFRDPEKRAALEGIVHPEVFRREAEITEEITGKSRARLWFSTPRSYRIRGLPPDGRGNRGLVQEADAD